MTTLNWLTNDPAVAKQLRMIDAAYDLAFAAARTLPLREKVDAIRFAKVRRQTEYNRIMLEETLS